MTTFITLAIYIIGIWVAYTQIQRWSDKKPSSEEEYKTVFMFSLLSWAIYPAYVVLKLIEKYKED